MRGFIVLCLSAVAMAAPEGYNYNAGAGAGQSGPGFGNNGGGGFGGGSVGGAIGSLTTTSGASGYFNGGAQNGGLIGQGIGGSSIGGFQQSSQQFNQQQSQQPIISKRFYIHSAPEEHDDEYREKHITVGVPRKNYNVVFIKAPAKSQKKTSIKITPAITEDKTVIYVLSKKSDAAEVHAEVLEHPTSTSKPEVFFIKYKTHEEAAHAQEQIQAQYDALGGSSQITDEGLAPITSVIGSLGEGAGADGHGNGIGVGGGNGGIGSGVGISVGGGAHGISGGGQTNNAYLPPSF